VLAAITRTAHAFAVHGHHAAHASDQTGEPLVAGAFQRLCVDQAKHPGEGVVRGDAVGPLQKGSEPRLPGLAKFDHFRPVVGPAHDCVQGNGQDIEQLMALGPQQAGIWHFAEVVPQALVRFVGHARTFFYGLF
jgi:hypothetical protein